MARTVRNGKIDTRSARAKLTPRREPYWTVVNAGCAIGYRKGAKGGTWVGRRRDNGKQHYIALGRADDARDANGGDVLSFAQAQTKARDWFDRATEPASGPYTVADAVCDYLDWFGRNRRSIGRARYQAEAYILPELGLLQIGMLEKALLEVGCTSSLTPRRDYIHDGVSRVVIGRRKPTQRRCGGGNRLQTAC